MAIIWYVTAFEVIVENAEICESKAQAEPTVPDPRTLGGSYVPDTYKNPQFEEVNTDERLPF